MAVQKDAWTVERLACRMAERSVGGMAAMMVDLLVDVKVVSMEHKLAGWMAASMVLLKEFPLVDYSAVP